MRLLSTLALLLMSTTLGSAHDLLVYIGTYTKTSSKGIYVGHFDTDTGKLGELTLAIESANPSFVTLSPDRRHLYAVSEGANLQYEGNPSGAVTAYLINPADGLLTPINTVASGGRGPCHVSITPDGKTVFTTNYGEGTVALVPVRTDGGLDAPAAVDRHEGHSVHPSRQKQPYAHSTNVSFDGRFAYTADLGNDQLYTYSLATAGKLTPATPPTTHLAPGSGPRHFAIAPDSRHAYLINELSNTVTVFATNVDTGALTTLQTISTLPSGFTAYNTAAEIAVHPSGQFVYGSNRGHDSIAVFGIDPVKGTLTEIEHVSTKGKNPRHFAIDPSGRWLIAANQDGESLVVFSIDLKTGRLTPTGQTLAVGSPVCVRFY